MHASNPVLVNLAIAAEQLKAAAPDSTEAIALGNQIEAYANQLRHAANEIEKAVEPIIVFSGFHAVPADTRKAASIIDQQLTNLRGK